MKYIFLLAAVLIGIQGCKKVDSPIIVLDTQFYTGTWKVHQLNPSFSDAEYFFLKMKNDGTGIKEDYAGNTERVSWLLDIDNEIMNIVGYFARNGETVLPSIQLFDIVYSEQNYQEWCETKSYVRTDTAGVTDTIHRITFWELTRQ